MKLLIGLLFIPISMAYCMTDTEKLPRKNHWFSEKPHTVTIGGCSFGTYYSHLSLNYSFVVATTGNWQWGAAVDGGFIWDEPSSQSSQFGSGMLDISVGSDYNRFGFKVGPRLYFEHSEQYSQGIAQLRYAHNFSKFPLVIAPFIEFNNIFLMGIQFGIRF